MGLTKSSSLLVLAACALCSARAEPSAELLDLAARVHYGFYHGDARAIDAAQGALERLVDSPEVFYYRDFAALRRSQLGGADRTSQAKLRECAQRDVAADVAKSFAADAWVLVAACALVSGDGRRSEHALALARARDDDNPRIALVEAWALEQSAGTDPARREVVVGKLTAAVEAFAAWTPSIDDPDWGHAEALTALAAEALERGQVRAARDLIERALLLAPEYRVAVELQASLQTSRAGNRTL
jgi:tetratricopeptide (TPR) repeat protein